MTRDHMETFLYIKGSQAKKSCELVHYSTRQVHKFAFTDKQPAIHLSGQSLNSEQIGVGALQF